MRVHSLFSILFPLSLVGSILTVRPDLPNEEQRDTLRDTMRVLLDFDQMPEGDVLRPLSRTPHTVSRHMKKLYERYVKGENEDGNVVRSIMPRTGKLNGEDVLVYDFQHIRKREKIMRVELHFNLREVHSTKRRARAVRAAVKCSHSYCTEDYPLQPLRIDSSSVSFDATLPFVHLHSLNATQMAVKLWRKDIQMRPYPVLIRRNAPFIIVFSESERNLDDDKIRRMAVEKNRIRTKRQTDYFAYSAQNDVTSTDSEEHSTRISPVLKTRKTHIRVNRRRKDKKKKDPWYGFGETTTRAKDNNDLSDEDSEEELSEGKDQLSVVLLDKNENQKTICAKSSFLIDFSTIGWDDHVIAPKSFDGGYCDGTCPYPLPQKTRPSNHALLHSLLFPLGPSTVCCAPDKMDSLTLLYLDQQHNLVLRNFPKMIVKSCSCM